MTLRELALRTLLAGPIVEDLLNQLRAEACLEVRGAALGSSALRYALTDKGRAFALETLAKSGYLGPAPVPLEQYRQVVRAQSVHQQTVTREHMRAAFANTVIRETLLDQLGPALHSGRAIFVYGAAGTGKSYIAQRLTWLLGDPVLIPHAIAVDDTAVRLFDPVIHKPIAGDVNSSGVMLEEGFDPRYTLCQRPAVLTGGELTLDMLEIRYDAATKEHQAPLQLKATNGIYVLDDLGRQRVPPVDLFNRWIVPLEQREDYLSLATGKRFPVPFDVVLVFSTNLNPRDLADEAFLRRLGHKIHFGYLAPEEYGAIWQQFCCDHGIRFDPAVLAHTVEKLHLRENRPMLACHPRDLLGMALDQARYLGQGDALTVEMIESAWRSYFVQPGFDAGKHEYAAQLHR